MQKKRYVEYLINTKYPYLKGFEKEYIYEFKDILLLHGWVPHWVIE